MGDIQNFLPGIDTVILALLVAAIGYISSRRNRRQAKHEEEAEEDRKRQEKNSKLHVQALMTLLELSIAQTHRHAVESGAISRYQLRTAIVMHRTYKELGGNGFVDELIDEIKRLQYSDIDEQEMIRRSCGHGEIKINDEE